MFSTFINNCKINFNLILKIIWIWFIFFAIIIVSLRAILIFKSRFSWDLILIFKITKLHNYAHLCRLQRWTKNSPKCRRCTIKNNNLVIKVKLWIQLKLSFTQSYKKIVRCALSSLSNVWICPWILVRATLKSFKINCGSIVNNYQNLPRQNVKD